MICLQYFCLSYGWYFYVTWLPTYFSEARHLDLTFGGVLQHRAAVLRRARQPGQRDLGRNWLRADRQRVATRPQIMAYIGFTGAGWIPGAFHRSTIRCWRRWRSAWPVSPTTW